MNILPNQLASCLLYQIFDSPVLPSTRPASDNDSDPIPDQPRLDLIVMKLSAHSINTWTGRYTKPIFHPSRGQLSTCFSYWSVHPGGWRWYEGGRPKRRRPRIRSHRSRARPSAKTVEIRGSKDGKIGNGVVKVWGGCKERWACNHVLHVSSIDVIQIHQFKSSYYFSQETLNNVGMARYHNIETPSYYY